MIIQEEGKTYYLTRQHYGTMIEFSRDKNGRILFKRDKARDDLSVPEEDEDKKINLVKSCLLEILAQKGEVNTAFYGYDVSLSSDLELNTSCIESCIEEAFFKSLNVNKEAPQYSEIRNFLSQALRDGQVDVFS